MIWSTLTTQIVELEAGIVDLNSSRDAVTAGSYGPGQPEYPSLVIRSDGTKIEFPARTMLSHIFDRNHQWTAAGNEPSEDGPAPVVYTCDT